MKNIKSIIMAVVLMACSMVAMANDTYIIRDNEVRHVDVSITEFNRIQVIGDRIASVRGPNGHYQLQTDLNLGQIFVKPMTIKPFTIFLTTENRKTYSIRLYAKKWSARNIELKPMGVDHQKAAHWEQSQPYESSLLDLIKAMFAGEKVEGYSISKVEKPEKQPLGDVAWITKYWVYQGSHLTGEIYRVDNRTKRALQLKPAQFYRQNVAAIAISSEHVAPNGSIWLYEVVSHG